jgi:hypothetical protein
MTTVVDLTKLDAILTDPMDVVGEIYVIRNTKTGMEYVGQAVSHRLNHGKYRPHGSQARFKQHISEAIKNVNNKVGCTYLNNAIRDDGEDAFVVEVIRYCPVGEMNGLEHHYITERRTLYPNGYNLRGGYHTSPIHHTIKTNAPVNEPSSHGGRTQPHTEATKQLTSRRLKELHATGALVEMCSNRAKQQHNASRLEGFADVAHLLDSEADLTKYIKERKSKADGSLVFVYVDLGGKKTRFWPQRQAPPSTADTASEEEARDVVAKPTSIDTVHSLRKEALDFLTKLKALKNEKP